MYTFFVVLLYVRDGGERDMHYSFWFTCNSVKLLFFYFV